MYIIFVFQSGVDTLKLKTKKFSIYELRKTDERRTHKIGRN